MSKQELRRVLDESERLRYKMQVDQKTLKEQLAQKKQMVQNLNQSLMEAKRDSTNKIKVRPSPFRYSYAGQPSHDASN